VLRLVGTAGGAAVDVPDVRGGAREETHVTKKTLFSALCEVADALHEECTRIDFSPHKIALEQAVERLDVIIDEVLEEGVHEEEADEMPC
jgi:predicted RNA-binding protein